MQDRYQHPAFPSATGETSGLTIREYFAAQAMVGLLSNRPPLAAAYIAEQAVEQADDLLAQLGYPLPESDATPESRIVRVYGAQPESQ